MSWCPSKEKKIKAMRVSNPNFSLSPTHTPLLYTDPPPRVFRERHTSIQRFPVGGEGCSSSGDGVRRGLPISPWSFTGQCVAAPLNALSLWSRPSNGSGTPEILWNTSTDGPDRPIIILQQYKVLTWWVSRWCRFLERHVEWG